MYTQVRFSPSTEYINLLKQADDFSEEKLIAATNKEQARLDAAYQASIVRQQKIQNLINTIKKVFTR
jgi:hypothetical protein